MCLSSLGWCCTVIITKQEHQGVMFASLLVEAAGGGFPWALQSHLTHRPECWKSTTVEKINFIPPTSTQMCRFRSENRPTSSSQTAALSSVGCSCSCCCKCRVVSRLLANVCELLLIHYSICLRLSHYWSTQCGANVSPLPSSLQAVGLQTDVDLRRSIGVLSIPLKISSNVPHGNTPRQLTLTHMASMTGSFIALKGTP